VAKVLAVGVMYPWESPSRIGHTACTLGGVNYESRGSVGIVKGSQARGAKHSLFPHKFHRVLTNAEARRAKKYADDHQGENYVWGGVPGNGGDCSGYVSGVICAADGNSPRRVFGTGTWSSVYRSLGFQRGLGPSPQREDPLMATIGDDILRYLKHLDEHADEEKRTRAEFMRELADVKRDIADLLEIVPRNLRAQLAEMRRNGRRGAVAAGYPTAKVEAGEFTLREDGIDASGLPVLTLAERLAGTEQRLAGLAELIFAATGARSADDYANPPQAPQPERQPAT
jgi:hypothetical protein